MFVGRREVRWKGWSEIFVFLPVSNMLWSRQQHVFAMKAYFADGQLVVSVQRAFRRHFDIPSRGRVPDRKSVLMRIDVFRKTRNVFAKKEKDLRRLLEHLKMKNKFVCQFRPVCDNDPTILTRNSSDNVRLQ
ncbi:hypothetical protein TNCV_3235171 [Trichonephila clavipes]|nr:hypothetical protein TNCV_3235171 [Trichonephila clavipes]